jgi:hypothetical protein
MLEKSIPSKRAGASTSTGKKSQDDNKINQPPLDNKGIPLQQYLQKEQVPPAALVKKNSDDNKINQSPLDKRIPLQ